MNKSRLLAIMLIIAATLISGSSFAQEKKSDKKAEREAKHLQEYADKCDKVLSMVESGSWMFTIYSIDEAGHSALSTQQLRGAYMISVKDGEMTVKLPLQGPNVRQGGAASALRDISFTTDTFVIEKTTSSDGTLILIGHSLKTDENLKYNYRFDITQNKENLTVSAPGVQEITYKGSFSDKKSK